MNWMHAVLLSIRPMFLCAGIELDPFVFHLSVEDDPFPS